jgi:hypothetical protein
MNRRGAVGVRLRCRDGRRQAGELYKPDKREEGGDQCDSLGCGSHFL